MREIEAYPNGQTWEQRASERFEPRQRVTIGPAFTIDGYEPDDITGSIATITGAFDGPDGPREYTVEIAGREYYMMGSRFIASA